MGGGGGSSSPYCLPLAKLLVEIQSEFSNKGHSVCYNKGSWEISQYHTDLILFDNCFAARNIRSTPSQS